MPIQRADISHWQVDGVHIVAFPARMLRVFAEPLDSQGFAPLAPDTAKGFVAAINGSMFSICGRPSGDEHATVYAAARCMAPDYLVLDRKNNLFYASKYPERGVTFSVDEAGNVTVGDGASYPSNAVVAIQTYPQIVARGRNIANPSINTERTWRAAIGVLADGRMAMAAGIHSMRGFADVLTRAGFVEAGYTDGGGSTSLWAMGERIGSREQRRVPVWIVAAEERSPLRPFAWPLLLSAASFIIGGILLLASSSEE
ncbi:MAG: phosphodiester glycosidase family protein [Candidatus Bathyarchaeia archaeon]